MSTDGGPAFPQPLVPDPDSDVGRLIPPDSPGMSLRDYFAAKAMVGLLTDHDSDWYPELSDLVEDPKGEWQYNPDNYTVYRTPTGYKPNPDHKRYNAVTTWHDRLAKQAYRFSDAMLRVRQLPPESLAPKE